MLKYSYNFRTKGEKMKENEEIVELNNFFDACDEFIDGKFILADIKIAKILRAISQSSSIYNIIAESLINYDFASESKLLEQESKEENNGDLVLPDDSSVIIPYVFSLLVEIDSKHISFNDFLASNFISANSQKEEYEAFAENIIEPFKDAIANVLELDESIQEQLEDDDEDEVEDDESDEDEEYDEDEEEIEEKDDDTLLFDRLSRMCNIIDDKLIFINKKDKRSNIELLINALKDASKMQNMNIVLALVMALNEFAHKEKKIKKEMDEINNICLEFFR